MFERLSTLALSFALTGGLVVPKVALAARPPEAVHHHRQNGKPKAAAPKQASPNVSRPSDNHNKNRGKNRANDRNDDRGKDKVDHDRNDDHGHDGANHK